MGGVIKPVVVANIKDKAASEAVARELGLPRQMPIEHRNGVSIDTYSAFAGGEIIRLPNGEYQIRTRMNDGRCLFVGVDPKRGVNAMAHEHDEYADGSYGSIPLRKGSKETAKLFDRNVGRCNGNIFSDRINALRRLLGLKECK